MTETRRSTLHLWLGTLLFVLILPCTAIVYVPYLLTGFRLDAPFFGMAATQVAGGLLVLAGLPVFLDFLWRFVEEGHGTPAPVAPTETLVVRGAFRWCRNPAYVAVVTILVGEALVFGSTALLGWAALLAVLFQLFVVLYEEPTLRRQFGEEYEAYCREVPRWLPRLRGRHP